MKTYIPLDRLKRSRDSGSALYNMPPVAVLGRAGGGGAVENGILWLTPCKLACERSLEVGQHQVVSVGDGRSW